MGGDGEVSRRARPARERCTLAADGRAPSPGDMDRRLLGPAESRSMVWKLGFAVSPQRRQDAKITSKDVIVMTGRHSRQSVVVSRESVVSVGRQQTERRVATGLTTDL